MNAIKSQKNIANPNPLILLSFNIDIRNDAAEKMNVSITPAAIKIIKSNTILEVNKPYIINGIDVPAKNARDKVMLKPKYWPNKIVFLFIGCASKSSTNSLEL